MHPTSEPQTKEERALRRWSGFVTGTPYSRELRMELVSASATGCVIRLPFQERLVGNPALGTMHEGVMTALLDFCCGMSLLVYLPKPRSVATLDLRLDHLRQATRGRDLYAHAYCHSKTEALAHMRGCVYHDSPDEPIAASVGNFMLTGGPVPSIRESA